MLLSYLTLFTGLLISVVAEYYSILGLIAIFAAAPIPVAIMGIALGIGKIVATIWLKQNWSQAPLLLKSYLFGAVVFLMMLTSIGCFGYLSKAHSDQSLVSGDVLSKVAIYDEKIRTERENIDANRKALKQLDEAVDQVMARSTDEKGADKAVAIRRSQQKDRSQLLNEITKSQQRIAALNDERAPIAAEVRKVEAEVGPIKYIAALVYGDNPDTNLLERAVRWVIILIVLVFDPLAVVLLLASQYGFDFARKKEEPNNEPKYEPDDGALTDDQIDQIRSFAEQDAAAYGVSKTWPFPEAESKPDAWVADVGEKPTKEELEEIVEQEVSEVIPKADPPQEKSVFEKHPYLLKTGGYFRDMKPLVARIDEDADDLKEVKEFFDNARSVAQALDRGEPLPEQVQKDVTVVEEGHPDYIVDIHNKIDTVTVPAEPDNVEHTYVQNEEQTDVTQWSRITTHRADSKPYMRTRPGNVDLDDGYTRDNDKSNNPNNAA